MHFRTRVVLRPTLKSIPGEDHISAICVVTHPQMQVLFENTFGDALWGKGKQTRPK